MSLFTRRKRIATPSGNRHRRQRSTLTQPAEVLEQRRLLTLTLDWTTRGEPGNDIDNFGLLFGGNAEAARDTVQAALDDWEQKITGFEGSDVSVDLNIFIDTTDVSTSGQALNVVRNEETGVPESADIRIAMALDITSSGVGPTRWYPDQNPDDHSEFQGDWINPYMRRFTAGGPADPAFRGVSQTRDLRSLILHEVGHVLGISSNDDALLYRDPDAAYTVEDTGIPNETTGNPGDTFWVYRSPSVNILMENNDIGAGTTTQPGHTGRPRANNVPVLYDSETIYGAANLMQSSGVTQNRRALIPDNIGLMLEDFGYDVVTPSQFGTFHTLLDESTGELTIRGGDDNIMVNFFGSPIPFGVSDDTISISMADADTLLVSIDAGRDNPGTGPNMTPFDQQDAFVSFFDIDDISSITINALDGADEIFIHELPAGIPLTINGDAGNDTITVGVAHIDLIQSDVTVVGGPDSDTLRVSDIFSGSGHAYDVETTEVRVDNSLTITHDVNRIELYAGVDDDSIDVNSLAAGQVFEVHTSLGENNVNVNLNSSPLATSVLGDVNVHGGSGDGDTLTINDGNSFTGTSYTITGDSVGRPGIVPVEYEGIDQLNVNGAILASSYHIQSTSTPTTVTGGLLGDSFRVGTFSLFAIDGLLTIDGGANFVGQDELQLDDALGTNGAYVIQNNLVTGNNFAGVALENVELATLDASPLDNIIHVENAPGGTRYVVNGHSGNDDVLLAFVSEDLSTIDTPLEVNGGSGDNSLFLYDESSFLPLSYTVTENSIDRLLFGEAGLLPNNIGVTFSSMTDVTLHMNSQSTNVNVQSTDPDTELIFYGNYGSDTLNLNRHLDGATDTNIHIDGPHITGENIDIQYYHFAQLNVNLGDENTRVVIEDLDSDADLNLGAGNDRLIITPESRNLTNINRTITVDGESGRDRLILHDQDNPWWANYTITPTTIDRWFFGPFPGSEPGATYDNMEIVRLFMTAHNDIVNLNGTNPDTWYDLRGRRGGDTFNINQPPSSRVTLRGGNGTDTANIFGTRGDDEVSISSGNGTADVNLISIEEANFNGLSGTDVLVYQGVEGVNEEVNVHASNIANKALLIVAEDVEGETLDLVFENTEILDLIANSGDDDTATFHGTADRDLFRINLAADGTNADAVLQLSNLSTQQPLLTLRDYRNFERLAVHGGDEADRFDVLVAPTGPGNGRNLFIDGGSPTGPGNPRDELHIFYARPPRPKIDREYNPQTDDGYASLAYEDYEFLIEFESIEKAKLKPLV